MKPRTLVTSLLLATLLACSAIALAQHQATLTHQASPTTGLAGYNVYRAPCTGTITNNTCSVTPPANAWVKVNGTPEPGLSHTDATIQAGQKYVYRVTAACPATGCSTAIAGESVPSNLVAITAPTDLPQPPSNLTVTQLAVVPRNRNRDQVLAAWNDEARPSRTVYFLIGDGRILKAGEKKNKKGDYDVKWTGKSIDTAILFVCNAEGTCAFDSAS